MAYRGLYQAGSTLYDSPLSATRYANATEPEYLLIRGTPALGTRNRLEPALALKLSGVAGREFR